jgi:hypothetical protein
VPLRLKWPLTPTTALSLSRVRVVAGEPRFTFPARNALRTPRGSASTSTFRPTLSAVFGLTPALTPPWRAPSIARCNWSAPPQNLLSPKSSKRKIWRPWRTSESASRWAEGGAVCDTALTVNSAPPARAQIAIRPAVRMALRRRLGRSIAFLPRSFDTANCV